MSWRDLVSRPFVQAFTANGTIDADDVMNYGLAVCEPTELTTLSLEYPSESLLGYNLLVSNDSATYNVEVYCPVADGADNSSTTDAVSDQTDGTNVIVTSENGTDYGWSAFDDNDATYWQSGADPATTEQSLQIEIEDSEGEKVACNKLILTAPNEAAEDDRAFPKTFVIEASGDGGTTWAELSYVAESTEPGEASGSTTFTWVNTVKYEDYRIRICDNHGDSEFVRIAECEWVACGGGGFVQDGATVTLLPGAMAMFHCNEDADGDFRWHGAYAPGTTEVIQDLVGAMFTGNTETNCTVTYRDGDGTIDVVVETETIQDIVGAMFTSNTETLVSVDYQDGDGTIDVVVDEEGIQDSIAALFTAASNAGISVTYNDGTPDIQLDMDYPTEWSPYSPTISWTDTAPASVTTVARYMQTGPNSVLVKVYFTSADGDGKTPDSITLPTISGKMVADIDALIDVSATEYIDTVAAGGAAKIAAWLDQEDGTEANRIIMLDGSSAWTDTKDCWVSVSVHYEIEDSA